MKKLVASLFALVLCAGPALSAAPELNCRYAQGNVVALTYGQDGTVKMAFKEAGAATGEILEGKPLVTAGPAASSAAQLYRKFTDRPLNDTFTVKVSTDAGKLVRVELPPFANQSAEPPVAGDEEGWFEEATVATRNPYAIPDPKSLGTLAPTYSEGRLAAIKNGWPMAVYIDSTPPILPFTVTSLDDGKFPWKKKGDVVWLIPAQGGKQMAYLSPDDAPPAGYCAECVKQTQYKGYTIQCGPNGCRLVPNAKATGGVTAPSTACASCPQGASCAASYGGCGGCQGSCSSCQGAGHRHFHLRRHR